MNQQFFEKFNSAVLVALVENGPAEIQSIAQRILAARTAIVNPYPSSSESVARLPKFVEPICAKLIVTFYQIN